MVKITETDDEYDSPDLLTYSTPKISYDVFVSFRGEDTRQNFTDHLYAALERKGIVAFRDEEELERGEIMISEKLSKAIDESMFAIVVFSKQYASSSWCLSELQKIVESEKYSSGKVFPIFYGVNPSDVRRQKGNIATALEKHERRFTKEKVRRWREALVKVADLAGWNSKDMHEARIIEGIVEYIWAKLRVTLPSNVDVLVGIQSKLDQMISRLKIDSDEKRFIGICGVGGVGKTTLARVVFEAIQDKFESSCFLANIREESGRRGLIYLQKKLLSCLLRENIEIDDINEGRRAIKNFACNKKVLFVLDDVSNIKQLESLARNEDWFGVGSKIVLTTRDHRLFRLDDRFEKYEIKMLNSDESLELFRQKAFRKNKLDGYYKMLSREIVGSVGGRGLPLVLRVLGSFLHKRSEFEWINMSDKLRQIPSNDILDTLRISFDGLENAEYKTIFLDFACFFNGEKKSEVTKILENCGLHVKTGIDVLIERSLLTCEDNFLYMHDLLQDMGKNIVRQESPSYPGRRSRLWSKEDIDFVMKNREGTEKIQSIVLNLEHPYEAFWHPNCFAEMHNLKLLSLSNVHLLRGLSYLPGSLKVLKWERYPLQALPNNIVQLYELVDLNLSHSKVQHLWNGRPFLGKLKFINLSHSDLIEMPDVGGVPNLESLILEGCINLVSIHPSLGQLKKLVNLNLKDCRKLEFSGYLKLEHLPGLGSRNMRSLPFYNWSGTYSFRDLPWSTYQLKKLREPSLGGGWKERSLTSSMELITTDASSSPKSSIPRWRYHVFLSFKGKDITKTFIDHLYTALQRKGIITFRDDEELEREVTSEKLVKAIEDSMFAIIILSKNYASSSWCLDELQKILESKQDLSQTVFPIFHGVDPSDIRHQRDQNFARAFEKHEERFTKNTVERWREALTKAANLAGWEIKDKQEAGVIEDITAAVWTELHIKLPPHYYENFVGIKSKVNDMISLLKVGLDDIGFVGIWGMGGIGKTTLATIVYGIIQGQFETSCFLANVREEWEFSGIVDLQNKLLSHLLRRNIEINNPYDGVKAIRNFLCNKKVLIVLDDVSDMSQLENLAGNKEWFGDGSRIIVTTRDVNLLVARSQFIKYKIQVLNKDESLKLLCGTSFKADEPGEGFSELSKKVVEYANGLPLALEVLGSFLRHKSQHEWEMLLDNLKDNLPRDIFKTLRLSYDGLGNECKKAFLDIACFFNKKKKDSIEQILKNCGLDAERVINVLIEKSLLSVRPEGSRDGFLYMHHLLQEMGRNIVLEESLNDIGRSSRLWSQENINLVLTRHYGTEEIQGIVLESQQPYKANWHPNCFSNMRNLRLLYLKNVHLLKNLNSLPRALKVLKWPTYPLQALPQNIDKLHELVELELYDSNINHLWNGTPILGNLMFINLSYSRVLIETPDLSGVSNLERLFLRYCTSLVKVHESLGQLMKLVELSLRGCENLVTLPRKFEMNSLEKLDLSECFKLKKLPEFGENMNKLSIFDIRGSYNIREVPSSIVHLKILEELSFRGCKGRALNSGSFSICFGLPIFQFERTSDHVGLKLPDSFTGLSLLRKLDLSYCNLCDGSIPNDLNGLTSLMILDLSENRFASLPVGCISNLVNLEEFYLSGCAKLQSMPNLPPNLLTVDASQCPSMKPLIDVKLLFASLLSKRRNVLSQEVILMLISGDTIPMTWLKKQECYVDPLRAGVSIIVDIPNYNIDDENNEWWGIAVCLVVKCWNPHHVSKTDYAVYWSFKALEDKSGFSQQKRNLYAKNNVLPDQPHLYIAFFPFNAQNCWQNVRGEELRQLQLHIEFKKGSNLDIKDCGWRMICKKDFDV